MGEILNYLREKNKKRNRDPKQEELFSILSVDNADESIMPFIELLKTGDFKKTMSTFNIKKNDTLEKRKDIIEIIKKFAEYLLKNELYKELFKQSFKRYPIIGEDKEIYEEVYNTSINRLELCLKRIIEGDLKEFTPFSILELTKFIRGDAFAFKLGDGIVRIEKDYLYKEDAIKLNEDHSDRPVYAYRAHVGAKADIGHINKTFKEMRRFLKTVDTGAKPYIGMSSRLLDMDFRRYRCEKRNRDKKTIDDLIAKYNSILGEIELRPFKDQISFKRTYDRIKKHSKKDSEAIDNYIEEGNEIKEGHALKILSDEIFG